MCTKTLMKCLMLAMCLGICTGYLRSGSIDVGMANAALPGGTGGSTGGTGGSSGGGTLTQSCPGGKSPICTQCSTTSNGCLTACSGDYTCHYNSKGICVPVLSSCRSY